VSPATQAAARPGSSRKPSLRLERALQRDGYQVLVGMDEVGRGALAGPVSAARERMVPRIQRWCLGWGVGHAWPEEIDAVGIMVALRLAGERALAQLQVTPDLVILDGNHDWLTDPGRAGLLGLLDGAVAAPTPVRTLVKADLRCSSVAAASVLAKVTRDTLMVGLDGEHPAYRWGINKGYAAPEHQQALREHGPCRHHRRSWNLTGTSQEVGQA
jgi:ribonuclease HII